MTASITKFPSGSFRLSRIVYIEDLQLADARAIPLGAIAEIVLPAARGLAMTARSHLDNGDLREIGPLMRERLAKPFDYLEPEFLRAWSEAPKGGALDLLLSENSSSLSMLEPRRLEIPKRWLVAEGASLATLVRPPLAAAADEEFFDMILEDLFVEVGPPAPEDTALSEHREDTLKFAA